MNTKYMVLGVLHATTNTHQCEASNPEEAIDSFFDSDKSCPSLCHQCSNEVEMNGEVEYAVVLDEDGNQVYSDKIEVKKISVNEVIKLLNSDKSKEEILAIVENKNA